MGLITRRAGALTAPSASRTRLRWASPQEHRGPPVVARGPRSRPAEAELPRRPLPRPAPWGHGRQDREAPPCEAELLGATRVTVTVSSSSWFAGASFQHLVLNEMRVPARRCCGPPDASHSRSGHVHHSCSSHAHHSRSGHAHHSCSGHACHSRCGHAHHSHSAQALHSRCGQRTCGNADSEGGCLHR